MIAANQRLFERLADAGGDLVRPELRQQKRAIQTSPDEKDWLKRLTLRSSAHLLLGGASKLAVGELDGALYMIAIGVQISEPPPEFERVAVNSGMFTAIALDLEVPILRTPNISERLLEYVFYPVEDDVEFLDAEVVKPFFQGIELYRIDSGSALVLDNHLGLRAATAAILCAPSARSLTWPVSALERIRFMVRDPAERAPFHLLLRALTETREDAAFLAIYRCVEQLFPIPAIAELSAELKLSAPTLGVAAAIERHLGWRRREEDAIAHLFAELEASLIDRMLPVVGDFVQDRGHAKRVSKRVYELRNQCVHYRPAHGAHEALQFGAWLELSDLMLEVVQTLYARYAGAFESPERAAAA